MSTDDVPVFTPAKANECRDRAAQVRNRAMAAVDATNRQALLDIARQWDVLAAEIDKFCAVDDD